ncbi:nucleotidyltransferase family protein [Blastomonas sp.]|uniref:nucleotidyltransferase family protein n=1 Tax=Blastomonas sp. TaxID=1909299 RepID=UPI003593523C
MDTATAIAKLKAHEAELRSMGVDRLSLFGSTARGEEQVESDIDLAARFSADAKVGGFAFVAIADRLETILRSKVDLIAEPARKPRMQQQIDRDRVNVF